MNSSQLLRVARLSGIAAICLWCGLGSPCLSTFAEEVDTVTAVFQDEPAARTLFDEMVKAVSKADSLSYECQHIWRIDDKNILDCTYRVWLKKPNYFRVEVDLRDSGRKTGILIGDGETAWLYWPDGRPRWLLIPEDSETYQNTRFTSYRRTPAPPGYSIGHAMDYMTSKGMVPIINPSTFFGYTDTLIPYLDGVRRLGTEQVGTQDCDKVEFSFMDHQRSWYLWLSKRKHLPRKLKQIVRVSAEHVIDEEWSAVTVDGEIPAERFTWSAPKDWTEWVRPKPDDLLLKPGTKAPDFDLAAADGRRIKLSDYKGQVVWLYIWRVGCPPCREGLSDLQDFYTKYGDQGLVIVGFNSSDKRDITMEFLQKQGATFPNVLDSSDAGKTVERQDYQSTGVPTNYIIGRKGKVVDAWYGHSDGYVREKAALEKAGLDLDQSVPKE